MRQKSWFAALHPQTALVIAILIAVMTGKVTLLFG